jgi:hypothetical protein
MTQLPDTFQKINNSELQLVAETQFLILLHSKDYAFDCFILIYDSYHLFLDLPKSLFSIASLVMRT